MQGCPARTLCSARIQASKAPAGGSFVDRFLRGQGTKKPAFKLKKKPEEEEVCGVRAVECVSQADGQRPTGEGGGPHEAGGRQHRAPPVHRGFPWAPGDIRE